MFQKHLISRQGYGQLRRHLRSLKKEYSALRTAVADAHELKDVDDYDLVEDHTRLAFLQKEITDLQYTLRTCKIARIIAGAVATVQIGSRVRLKYGHKELRCMLVSSLEADPSAGKISDESPLGRALLGKMLNTLVEVIAPRKRFLYRIVGIEQPQYRR